MKKCPATLMLHNVDYAGAVKDKGQTGSENRRDSTVCPAVEAETGLLFRDVQRSSETFAKFHSHQFVSCLAQAAAQTADHVLQ